MKFRTVLLFGAPGAGKGTQGRILGSIPDFFHCACGDVFRNLSIDTELGRIFQQYSSKGKLVPDEYTVRLWRENIQAQTQLRRFHPEHDTLVLDGIPRNRHQAEMLSDTLGVVAVFNLVCSDIDKLVERLQRRALRENRLDDANLDVIRKRLGVYEKETRPLLEFYGAKIVHSIDSEQTPINVLREILRVLAKT
jgi:adenylate kinase